MRAVRLATGMLLVLGLLGAPTARAHVASNGFLQLEARGAQLDGVIELAVRDVEIAVGVDSNRDGKVTWGELRAAEPRLRQYLEQHLGFAAQGEPCALSWRGLAVRQRVDGSYASMAFVARCVSEVRQLRVHYELLADDDPSHRGLLSLSASSGVQAGVLGGADPDAAFRLDQRSRGAAFRDYLRAGIAHIWGGIDHLLFLLSLLLPAVLRRDRGGWHPVAHLQPALFDVLKVVTAFTLAHSITLSLAALDLVRLPSRLTESVIAASIIVAALNNLVPLVTESRARIAFAFGLLHGFGFASVLADMGLPPGARLTCLLAFNLGIESGQLAVVAGVMPLAYLVRGGALYRRGIMPWGSAAIAAVAAVWLVQRAWGPGA